MKTNPAYQPDDYPRWIDERIGAEVRERREALNISAYALGRSAGRARNASRSDAGGGE